MEKYFTVRKIIVIVTLFIIAIAVPFFINELYKDNAGYITIWGAEEVLAFYGELLGSLATIGAVYLTIDYSVYREKCVHKNSIRPFLSTTYFRQYDYAAFVETFDNVEFICLSHDGILNIGKEAPLGVRVMESFTKNLNMDSDDVKNGEESYEGIKRLAEIMKFGDDFFMIEYTLENFGGGNAIEVEMKINHKLVKQPFALNGQNKKIFRVFIDTKDMVVGKDWEITFLYDFYDQELLGKYRQNETITLIKDEYGVSLYQHILDFMSVPREIKIV